MASFLDRFLLLSKWDKFVFHTIYQFVKKANRFLDKTLVLFSDQALPLLISHENLNFHIIIVSDSSD